MQVNWLTKRHFFFVLSHSFVYNHTDVSDYLASNKANKQLLLTRMIGQLARFVVDLSFEVQVSFVF